MTTFIFSHEVDSFASETSWKITNQGEIIKSGLGYVSSGFQNIPIINLADGCYEFSIYDWDGLCCDYGFGSYNLTDVNGNIIFDYNLGDISFNGDGIEGYHFDVIFFDDRIKIFHRQNGLIWKILNLTYTGELITENGFYNPLKFFYTGHHLIDLHFLIFLF